ncbi:Hypothetical predicted protein [Cloeon dipterum]|uniref:Uncharacterized protein n=1 Tax=Cloeon dipterum TaxID=197152 RepID=A0A8S1CPR3_9INSE|nr:Hypothetical predicted protein [Cloeon dipterum]
MGHLCNLLIVLMTVALISPISTDETTHLPNNSSSHHGIHLELKDQYNSTQSTIFNNELMVEMIWIDMDESGCNVPEHAPAVISLPSNFTIFGTEFAKIEVLRDGGIRSVDPKQRWSAIPLKKREFGLIPCNIRFQYEGNTLSIQWQFRNQVCNTVVPDVELSFQVTLYTTGRVDFIYKTIPLGYPVLDIDGNFGLSYQFKVPGSNDSFTLGLPLKFNKTVIQNDTIIVIKPQPLCSNFLNSSSCLVDSRNLRPPLLCFWCPAVGICSSKRDFLKEVWEDNSCDCHTKSGTNKFSNVLDGQ